MGQPLMRWLLDTNVWIDAHAGRDDARRVFDQARKLPGAWLGYSSITKVEVLGYGGLTSTEELALRTLFSHFEEVPVTSTVIDEAIRIRAQHRMKTPDAIIAATAVIHRADLVTRDLADFKRVSGLKLLETQGF
jgi:predicted nucleic acid-binding protein